MVNRISCGSDSEKSLVQQLASDTIIEVLLWFSTTNLWFFLSRISVKIVFGFLCVIQVSIEIPFAFQVIPKQAIESAGTQVLEQILRIMLPRFMSQVCYKLNILLSLAFFFLFFFFFKERGNSLRLKKLQKQWENNESSNSWPIIMRVYTRRERRVTGDNSSNKVTWRAFRRLFWVSHKNLY